VELKKKESNSPKKVRLGVSQVVNGSDLMEYYLQQPWESTNALILEVYTTGSTPGAYKLLHEDAPL